MAGDWIKLRCNLRDDPAVIRICDLTGLDEFGVVGRLHALWSWADQHIVCGERDGNAPSVTQSWIDRYLQCENFAKALTAVGWLRQDDDGLVFPNFAAHNGKTAKERALTARRVQAHKAKMGNAKGNAKVTVRALPREEKNIIPPKSPPGGTAGKQVSRKPEPSAGLERFRPPEPLPGESMEAWRDRIHKARAAFEREKREPH